LHEAETMLDLDIEGKNEHDQGAGRCKAHVQAIAKRPSETQRMLQA
jgi:hypothetical protein